MRMWYDHRNDGSKGEDAGARERGKEERLKKDEMGMNGVNR